MDKKESIFERNFQTTKDTLKSLTELAKGFLSATPIKIIK